MTSLKNRTLFVSEQVEELDLRLQRELQKMEQT